MVAELSGRKKPTKSKKHLGAQKRKRDDVDVEKLEQAVENLVCHTQSQMIIVPDDTRTQKAHTKTSLTYHSPILQKPASNPPISSNSQTFKPKPYPSR